LGGIKGKTDEAVCPLCLYKEHANCILLICPETSKLGELLIKKMVARKNM